VWLSSLFLAQAQGIFWFSNLRPTAGINAPVFDADGKALEGTNYLAALYVGNSVDSMEPAIEYDGAPLMAVRTFRTGAAAGYLFNNPPMVLATNVSGGEMLVWVQMRAWDAALGATYEAVLDLGLGGYGESPLFQAIPGHEGIEGPLPRDLVGLESFSLRPVIPEPGTLSLFLVALPVLWLASRRGRPRQPGNDPGGQV
jgi:hypothetical protein